MAAAVLLSVQLVGVPALVGMTSSEQMPFHFSLGFPSSWSEPWSSETTQSGGASSLLRRAASHRCSAQRLSVWVSRAHLPRDMSTRAWAAARVDEAPASAELAKRERAADVCQARLVARSMPERAGRTATVECVAFSAARHPHCSEGPSRPDAPARARRARTHLVSEALQPALSSRRLTSTPSGRASSTSWLQAAELEA